MEEADWRILEWWKRGSGFFSPSDCSGCRGRDAACFLVRREGLYWSECPRKLQVMHEHSLYLSQWGRLCDSCRACLSKQQITILKHSATSSGEQEIFGFAHSGAVCGTAQPSFTSWWWGAGLWPHDTVQSCVGLQARFLRRGGGVRVVSQLTASWGKPNLFFP